MASQAFSGPGLTFRLEEKPEETIVHCIGRITAESAELLQTEIRDRVIPVSRGKGMAVTSRVVLDLSDVTYVDSTGLGALVSIYMAANRANCILELANPKQRVRDLFRITKLASIFEGRGENYFGGL